MTEAELISLGIKTLRKQKNMTLADMAEATGFSISYLSKVERNQGSITIDAVAKICSAMGMDLIEFLRMDFSKDIVVVRKEERKTIYNSEGIIKYDLVTGGHQKKLKGMVVTVYPSDSRNFAKVCMPHTTDELAFILDGEMILAIVDKDGNTTQTLLKTGDSFYVYAWQKHAFKCHGSKPCQSLWSYLSPHCFADDDPSQH